MTDIEAYLRTVSPRTLFTPMRDAAPFLSVLLKEAVSQPKLSVAVFLELKNTFDRAIQSPGLQQ
jgi:hypothetical protein